MAEWVAVCRLDELRDGAGRSLDALGLRLAVFRTETEVVALFRPLPPFGRLSGAWLDRRGRSGLPASSLAVQTGRWPLHNDQG